MNRAEGKITAISSENSVSAQSAGKGKGSCMNDFRRPELCKSIPKELKGAPVAAALTADLKIRAAALKETGVTPKLVILRVGGRKDDLAYEQAALRRCETVGIQAEVSSLPEVCSAEKLFREIDRVNEDKSVHGCLIFRPLPKGLDEYEVCERLNPQKDVDGITGRSLTAILTGRGSGFAPCTAQACLELLDYYRVDPAGKRVAVIGRSLVIGRPLALLLLDRDATVTVCHSATADLPTVCREADILIAAAGRSHLVDEKFTTDGQIILDVGVNVDEEGKISGDVEYEYAAAHARAITPVPGGIGSVTTAVLCKHVIEAAERRSAECS